MTHVLIANDCTYYSPQLTGVKILLNLASISSALTAQVTYSLDGCIRNLRMEQAPVNLDQPTSSFHVGTCFANAQRGTYFDGTGFAKAGEGLPHSFYWYPRCINTDFLPMPRNKNPPGPELFIILHLNQKLVSTTNKKNTSKTFTYGL